MMSVQCQNTVAFNGSDYHVFCDGVSICVCGKQDLTCVCVCVFCVDTGVTDCVHV